MSQVLSAADELEELRRLKARYCRFLDTKDVESWRAVFTTDVVVTLDMAVSVGAADPKTAPRPETLQAGATYVQVSALPRPDAEALVRVRAAMIAEPFYVAGTGRFDTDLLRAGSGRIACKAGAEGVHASALLDAGAGLVRKVVDGSRRAAAPAAVALLAQLHALDEMQVSALAAHASVPVENVAGVRVGSIAAGVGN